MQKARLTGNKKEQVNSVANKMHNAGFITEATGDSVMISLNSRKVSKTEATQALGEIFRGTSFSLELTPDGVLVSWQAKVTEA